MQQLIENSSKEQTDYAVVELVGEKGGANSIEKGLLRGINEEGGESFLWLVTEKKISRAINLADVNILSVETFDGLTRAYTFFMADEDEQKYARKLAEETFESLKKLALPAGGLMLDVSKFKNVPEDFGKPTAMSAAKKTNLVGTASQKPAGTVGDSWYGNQQRKPAGYTSNSYYNTDPEPCAWKRKSRKPTKKALEKLRGKLDLLAKKELKYTMPVVKTEKEEAEKKPKAAEKKANAAATEDPNSIYEDENMPFAY